MSIFKGSGGKTPAQPDGADTRRALVSLFDFVRIRVSVNGQPTSAWGNEDLEAYQRPFDLIGDGECEIAEQYVRWVMEHVAKIVYGSLEKREEHAR